MSPIAPGRNDGSARQPGAVQIAALDLHKSYGRNEVLHGIDLEVRQGDVVTIVGPSGSGKSTLLRCLNLLELPTSGVIEIFGTPVRGTTAELCAIRRRVGMVFQAFNLFPHLTVLQNVAKGPRVVSRLRRDKAEAIAMELLAKVGVAEKANNYPNQCSGGQQQRIAIARAMAMRPEVILFDEPTSALDPELRAEVLEVMRTLAAEGMTMVIVTHEMAFARKVANRAVFIDGGRIVEEGPPAEILLRPQSARLQQFLNLIFWGEE